jgi:acetyl-CoA carboxylase biotin carboxylase subunit
MNRILIANRGEIACRIIRACHEEGLEAVAVYSEADRESPHVRESDLAVEIGPAAARDSYLNVQRVLDAARATGADALHPGYGFLAERASFAAAVEQAGLVFIGPGADAIQAMGEKTEARRRMEAAGVPIVPGTTEPLDDAAAAQAVAERLGYPIMLKAAAGGGGKGMRRVADPVGLAAAFRAARSEAESAFGDGAVYLEQCVQRPRHVEIQVMADHHGRVVHVGERECSVQRRHQKLIEEAPSPAATPELRAQMGDAAVRAARAVGYRNAGTVEFLLDPQGRFYVLEMNTRIQVEHPVTELVYGVDLVREQLRVAAGKPLGIAAGLTPRGHAIECRITSEDPTRGFLPATGRIAYLRVPSGPGVRWDGGIEVGSDIGVFYDPLLAKLIVWGENREHAIRRMRRALDELLVVGVPTSHGFHRRALHDAEFVSGRYDIDYLARRGDTLLATPPDDGLLESAALAAALAEHERREASVALAPGAANSGRVGGWAVGRMDRRLAVEVHDGSHGNGAGASPWLRAARLAGLR